VSPPIVRVGRFDSHALLVQESGASQRDETAEQIGPANLAALGGCPQAFGKLFAFTRSVQISRLQNIMKHTFWLLFLGMVSCYAAFEIEINDSSGTANSIVPGQAMTGQLSSGTDQDWFAFAMSSSGVVNVSFTSPENAASAGFEFHTVQIRDSSGAILASVETGVSVTFQTGLTNSGNYYVVIKDGPYGFLSTRQCSVTITTGLSVPTVEAEPNNATNQANQLSLGQKHYGQLNSLSDQDWFSFNTNSTGLVTVVFDSPENAAMAGFEFHTIQVVNASGTVFGSFDTGEDKTFQVGVPSAGTYYVVVKDGPYGYLSTKQYGLTVTTTASAGSTVLTAQIYSSVEVVWNSTAGKIYIIERSENLTNWFPLSSNILGTGGEMSYLDSIRDKTKAFYRVKEY
jgi:hypothetical protein